MQQLNLSDSFLFHFPEEKYALMLCTAFDDLLK